MNSIYTKDDDTLRKGIMCVVNDVNKWNSIISTYPPYKDILDRTSLSVTSSYLFLFRQDRITTIDEALEKLISFVYIDKVVLDGIDGIVEIINSVTSSRANIAVRKMRAKTNELDHASGKLGLLDASFRFILEEEEPSDKPKIYYNPHLKINVDHYSGFKYVSHVLRIACHSAVHFYNYILTQYGYDFNSEDTLMSLLNSKDAIDLSSVIAITHQQLENACFNDDILRVSADSDVLLKRSLPYINSKRGKVIGVRKTIPKAVKTALWDRHYPGKLKGPCFCCKTEIDARNFEAGHIVPYCQNGPDTVDNLIPICRLCNSSMGSMHLDEYMKRYHSSPDVSAVNIDNPKEEISVSNYEHIDKFLSTLYTDPLYRVKSKDLKDAYKNWCVDNGYRQAPIKEFDQVVVSKYPKIRDICVYYSGVCVKEPSCTDKDYDALMEILGKLKDTTTLLRDLQRKGVSRIDLDKLKSESLPDIILEELTKI